MNTITSNTINILDPSQSCQDSSQYASNCPGWATWACSSHTSFMEANCKKSFDLCPDT